MANAAAIAAAFGGGLPPGITGTNERSTVLVSNLNSDVRTFSSFYKVLSLSCLFVLKSAHFRELMRISYSTCSLFMGIL